MEQNRRLREENEELREHNRQLQEELRGEAFPLPDGLPHLTRREAAALRAENEARWSGLVADFRSLGLESVAVHTHDLAGILDAFLRWADLRQMWRGALA